MNSAKKDQLVKRVCDWIITTFASDEYQRNLKSTYNIGLYTLAMANNKLDIYWDDVLRQKD